MEALKLIFVSIPKMARLSLSILLAIRKGKRQANRASKIFEKRLIAMGIDENVARKFADMYKKLAESISANKLF